VEILRRILFNHTLKEDYFKMDSRFVFMILSGFNMRFILFSVLVFVFIFLAELGFAENGQGKKVSFGFNSGYLEGGFTDENEMIPSLESALKNPGEVVALKLSAASKNLSEIKNLSTLKFLYLDETFTTDNFYLSAQGLEKLFAIFGDLPALEYLSVNDSRLLVYMKHLKNLKGLKIKKFDWNIFQNHINNYDKLEILIIEDVLATKLPAAIGRIPTLMQLELNTISCSALPDLSLLQNLIVFKATLGKIQKFDPSIATLKALKYFKVDGLVKFDEFPKEICSLENLEELHIELRNANPIPDEIGNISNLSVLYLADCQNISKLPATIVNLKKLKEIYFSDAKSSIDISPLQLMDHPFVISLNRCNYVNFAKQLSNNSNLQNLIIPSGTLLTEVKKIEKFISPEKILKKDY
jgi:hypothetical protein